MTKMTDLPEELEAQLKNFAQGDGQMVVLTGAGISAESGIPTFRGKEGYWVRGSQEYQPEQMATHAMFSREPEMVWSWYLYRRGVCRTSKPNAGHQAICELDRFLQQRFLLITQNVDGLHQVAGNPPERTFQIHGNIDFARCESGCGKTIWPLPKHLGLNKARGSELADEESAQLRCPSCEGWARPHVLWFDECYDEATYHFHSSLQAAVNADVLLVVGTSGATNLPMQVGHAALQNGATIVDVNPEPNPFSRMAQAADCGFFLQGGSGEYLPAVAEVIRVAIG